MASKQSITDQEIRKAVDDVFMNYDKDKSGYLDCKELRQVIQDVFMGKEKDREVTDNDLTTVLKTMDRNKDGKVSRDELFVVIKTLNQHWW